MNDIVDRLRRAGKSPYDPLHLLMQEAADEIERLRRKPETAQFEPSTFTIEQPVEINGILYEPGTYVLAGSPPYRRS